MSALGKLVVSLALDAAEFTSGMKKSEYQARQFARRIDNEIAKGIIKAQIAIEAFGRTAQKVFEKAITDVGNFKQISEQIGDTAEAVAALDKAAATSGVSLNEIASISARLTATLSKTDEEGDSAAQALRALGLNAEEFRRLSPVAQLETLAKALDKFAEGSGRSAVAVALLGKSGASALPFLNDLADQGGRTVQMTQEQIEVVDRYSKELARMGQEAAVVARIFASDLIRELMRLQEEFREGIVIAGGFWNALVLFGTISPFKDVAENLRDVRKGLDEANEAAQSGAFYQFLSKMAGGFFERAADGARRQLEFLKLQQRNQALQLISESNNDARDYKARQKPFLDFTIKDKGKGATGKTQVNEAEQYLRSLEKQIMATQDLTAVEQARMAIAGDLKGITPELKRQIMLYAEMVDFLKKVKEEEQERQKIEADAARSREEQSRAMTRAVEETQRETQAIRDGNQQLEDQIVFLTHGAEAVDRLTVKRIESLIQQKKDEAFALANIENTERQVAAINEQIAALERRKQLFAETKIAEQIAKEAAQLQDLKDAMSDALVQPLVDFVNQTKSAKDAFKSFINTVQQMLLQKAARSVTDWIFGGQTQSGFDLSTIFKLLSGFGSMFPGGTGYLPPGAMGPPMFATGTSYAPGGGAWIGERGPEFVSLPAGARVTPANQMRSSDGGRSLVFNVNVMPGADTRSAKQVGAVLRDTVIRSIKDR